MLLFFLNFSFLCALCIRNRSVSINENLRSRSLPLPRFVQSKGDVLYAITNLFYPGDPKIKPLFQTGGCPGWYLDGSKPIVQDWLHSENGWSYDLKNGFIVYNGGQKTVEPVHPFPFHWLPQRSWSETSLIKKNFFCPNTQMSAKILFAGAGDAGFLFRIKSKFNFWAVLLKQTGEAMLIRVIDGEPITLLKVPIHITTNKWYLVKLQELIGDVRIEITSLKDNITKSAEWSVVDDEEISDEDQGAVGLIANGGTAKFLETIVGNVNWTPEEEHSVAQKMNRKTVGETDFERKFPELGSLDDRLKGWCPSGSLCAGKPYNYSLNRTASD